MLDNHYEDGVSRFEVVYLPDKFWISMHFEVSTNFVSGLIIHVNIKTLSTFF